MFLIVGYIGYQNTEDNQIFFTCHSKVTDYIEYYMQYLKTFRRLNLYILIFNN